MKNSKPPLTEKQRDQIVGMLLRKDRIQDIAYLFGRSPSTIWGVKEKIESGLLSYVGYSELPRPGPYKLVDNSTLQELSVKAAAYDAAAAERASAAIIVRELRRIVERYEALAVAHTARIPLNETV